MAIERITRITGRGLPLRGNDIDTDRIIPARFLKSISFEGLENHLFEDDIAQARAQNAGHAIVDPTYAGASILVVNRNFGCGSSREHAPAGDPPQGVSCGGGRVVLRNLLRELGGARDAVRLGQRRRTSRGCRR